MYLSEYLKRKTLGIALSLILVRFCPTCECLTDPTGRSRGSNVFLRSPCKSSGLERNSFLGRYIIAGKFSIVHESMTHHNPSWQFPMRESSALCSGQSLWSVPNIPFYPSPRIPGSVTCTRRGPPGTPGSVLFEPADVGCSQHRHSTKPSTKPLNKKSRGLA